MWVPVGRSTAPTGTAFVVPVRCAGSSEPNRTTFGPNRTDPNRSDDPPARVAAFNADNGKSSRGAAGKLLRSRVRDTGPSQLLRESSRRHARRRTAATCLTP